MINTLRKTDLFSEWLAKLRDMRGKARILARITSARAGHFGDCRSVGEGVFEMRIDVGPGYRVYYAQEGQQIYLLLLGGDKSTQKKDITKAKTLWQTIKEEA